MIEVAFNDVAGRGAVQVHGAAPTDTSGLICEPAGPLRDLPRRHSASGPDRATGPSGEGRGRNRHTPGLSPVIGYSHLFPRIAAELVALREN